MNTLSTENQEKIIRLEEDIKKLKSITLSSEIDLSNQIKDLEEKLRKLKIQTYENLSPYEKVTLSRDIRRPTTADYISNICSDFIEVHGDRLYKDDPSIITGIAKINDFSVTIVGHQKGRNIKENIKNNFGMPHPEGYRKAIRVMKQAEKFNRPIITFIDTPGAFCGVEAEQRGQGEAIAKNLIEMSKLTVPIISIVIGEGGSGGALGIGMGNDICMLEHSVYSVISPEGLSSILFKDASKSKEASDVMKLTSSDLLGLKIVDKIINEPFGGAQEDIVMISRDMKKYIIERLNYYKNISSDDILSLRYKKYREIGRCI